MSSASWTSPRFGALSAWPLLAGALLVVAPGLATASGKALKPPRHPVSLEIVGFKKDIVARRKLPRETRRMAKITSTADVMVTVAKR